MKALTCAKAIRAALYFRPAPSMRCRALFITSRCKRTFPAPAALSDGKSERDTMRFPALLLALPLALGTGVVWAQSTTSTETKTSDSMAGTQSRSSSERTDAGMGTTVEKHDSATKGPDGSVSTESNKTVNRPN